MDILGPSPDSSAGNRWVAAGYVSRYAVTSPLLTGTAVDVAEFVLHEVILKHGAPREPVSTVVVFFFFSSVVAEILCLLSGQRRILPMDKRDGSTLKKDDLRILSMYISFDHRDWDVVLPYVTFAYNSSRHDTTGYSLFYVPFGREQSLMTDSLLPLQDELTLMNYVPETICRAEGVRNWHAFERLAHKIVNVCAMIKLTTLSHTPQETWSCYGHHNDGLASLKSSFHATEDRRHLSR